MAFRYATASHNPSVLSGTVVSSSGVYVNSTAGAILSLSGISGSPHAVIYVPNGTVTITGDIVYSSAGATSFKELPSLTVIARDIVIDASVSEIAGNYYASNTFVTCNQGPRTAGDPQKSALVSPSGACYSKRLIVNGTVTVANQTSNSLVLNRSFGGTQVGQPAEVIRMRPESFLTDYENNQVLTTINETELPPRY